LHPYNENHLNKRIVLLIVGRKRGDELACDR
jgi:hypothetical protein